MNLRATIVEDAKAFIDHGKPGDILPIFIQGINAVVGFAVRCPRCGHILECFITEGIASLRGTHHFEVVGFPGELTLSPAFDARCCGWKGELKDGEFIEHPCIPIGSDSR